MRHHLMAAAMTAVMGLGASAAPLITPIRVPGSGHIQFAQAVGVQATVRVDSAILRSAPDQKSTRLTSLRRGTRVQVISQLPDWTHVRVGGREGIGGRLGRRSLQQGDQKQTQGRKHEGIVAAWITL